MNFFRYLGALLSYPFQVVLSAPMAVFTAPRKFLGLSLPARVSLSIALLLVIVWLCVSATLASTQRAPDLYVFLRNTPAVLILIVVIALVTYQALRLWLDGSGSRFPDIDAAWKTGLESLSRNGLSLTELPLFVILGPRNEQESRALFKASGLELKIRDLPTGPSPLYWSATAQAIYLVVADACRMSALANKLAIEPAAGPTHETPVRQAPRNLRGTMEFGSPFGSEETAPGVNLTGTADQGAGGGVAVNLRGTMEVARNLRGTAEVGGRGAVGNVPQVQLTAAESAAAGARLEYVCKLLQRARQPYCALNGLLAVISFPLIQRGDLTASGIRNAARDDLTALRQATHLRFPVTALIGGMETEVGFRELVRRLGTKPTMLQRFGKGFGVWNPPIPEQVEAVCTHACGAFEDFVYNLFKEKDGFNKPGNTKLYQLLCKIRSQFRDSLTKIIVDGFASDPEKPEQAEPLLFSGCYFAATGDSEDRQAFVRAIFDKLATEENDLQWLADAQAQDRWYRNLARVNMAISGVLLIAIIYLVLT